MQINPTSALAHRAKSASACAPAGLQSFVLLSVGLIRLRSVSTLLGAGSLLVLTVESLHDPSTIGVASKALLGAICVLPFAAGFSNAAFGSRPKTYLADALLPALAFYAAILAGSLLCGARALNWLVVSVVYLVFFSALGFAAGKLARRA